MHDRHKLTTLNYPEYCCNLYGYVATFRRNSCHNLQIYHNTQKFVFDIDPIFINRLCVIWLITCGPICSEIAFFLFWCYLHADYLCQTYAYFFPRFSEFQWSRIICVNMPIDKPIPLKPHDRRAFLTHNIQVKFNLPFIFIIVPCGKYLVASNWEFKLLC